MEAVLKKSLEGADIPNLLTTRGPRHRQDESTILAAARDHLFGDMYRSRILELNASDERGIQVVRDKSRSSPSSPLQEPGLMVNRAPALDHHLGRGGPA